MSKTVKRILVVATACYLCSYLSDVINDRLYPDRFYMPVRGIWQWLAWFPLWTAWDFISCLMLVVAVGCTVAALRLHLDELREMH